MGGAVTGERVGFVGLGHMGASMCEQVVRAGFEVTAFDLRPEAVAAAAGLGARPAGSVAECAAAADLLVTMLPGPPQVEAVMLGDDGALAALAPGSLAIDMSTSSAAVGERVAAAGAARGVAVVDAPVADALRAPEGRLHIFVGGDAADVSRARPLLEAMGDPDGIVHVGGHGAGYAVKLLVNLQWFVHAAVAAEALAMGARAGIDVRALHAIFAAGPARSAFLEHEALEVLEHGEYGERFPLALVAKDLGLALELAETTGVPTPVSRHTRDVYEQARAELGDGAGEMGAVQLVERLTGTRLRFELEPARAG